MNEGRPNPGEELSADDGKIASLRLTPKARRQDVVIGAP